MGAIEKLPTSPFGWELINDLSALPDDENSIIEYLLRRVERGQIYTWVGALLLALNPDNVVLSDQYNSVSVELANVNEIARKDVIPDINAIASRAHYRLLQELGKSCQVVIISGDSGTGKTFNANKALNFLAALNDASSPSSVTQSIRIRDIVRKITSACPLISAFSTATTERNLRSSRHGQLIKLEYDNSVICGATIRSFLLERSRVTMGFDNFHIFYQLLAGLSEAELQHLNLSKLGIYNLISNDNKIQDAEFNTNFEETVEAMSDLGFTVQERNDIFQVISVLLHLGNIKFKKNYLGSCTVNTDDKASQQALHHLSAITSLTELKLIEFLTTSLINRNNKNHTVDHCELRTTEMCYNRLHSMIRHIYYQLFLQLINRINKSLSSGFECETWLGILDIFGFEVFTENKIEQLCINYANERLQLYFMQDYLDSARTDMMQEGFIDFIESEQTQVHKDRLAVIEGHLFPVLIDATQCSAQFNETTLRHRLLDHTSIKFLSLPQDSQTFIIQHYSSPVEYSFDKFVSKNIDKVPPELSMIFEKSQNDYLNSLKDSIDNETNQVNGKIYAKKSTTLAKVRQSLDSLVRELSKCDTHYVRCVKPCRKSGLWLKDDFKEDLKCIGIFDALSLSKCKYPIRTSYQEFVQRYRFKKYDLKDVSSVCKSLAQEIFGSERVQKTIHFGTKLIFLTETAFFELEGFRKKYRSFSASKIQRFWKSKRKSKVIVERNKNSNAKSQLDCNKSPRLYHLSKIIQSPTVTTQKWDENKILSNNNDVIYDQKSRMKELKFSKYVQMNNKINISQNTKKAQNCRSNGKYNFKLHKDNGCDNDKIKLVTYEGCVFHCKNHMISRQRLAEVPVRFHVRRTCLEESHRLPRSELPRGLIDCL